MFHAYLDKLELIALVLFMSLIDHRLIATLLEHLKNFWDLEKFTFKTGYQSW